jgi:hypothetical protein
MYASSLHADLMRYQQREIAAGAAVKGPHRYPTAKPVEPSRPRGPRFVFFRSVSRRRA